MRPRGRWKLVGPALAALVTVPGCGRSSPGEGGRPDPDAGTDPVTPVGAPAPRILIDGRFDDWRGVPVAAGDPTEGERAGGAAPAGEARTRPVAPDGRRPPAGLLGPLRVTGDPTAAYFSVSFAEPMNLQGLDGALLLVLDTDGRPETGPEAFGVPGSDLIISFTRLEPSGAAREGIALWRPDPEDPERVTAPSGALDAYSAGVAFEPRHTTSRVEIRIARGEMPRISGLELAGRFLGVLSDGTVVDRTPVFRWRLEGEGGAAGVVAAPRRAGPEPGDVAARSGAAMGAGVERGAAADFRLLSWNVSHQRLIADPDRVRRILAALEPDIVLLDEVPPGVRPEWIAGVLPAVGGGGGRSGWSVHVGTSGTGQRGVVAARGRVTGDPAFARIPYPDSIWSILEAPSTAALRAVASNARAGGVPATAARVELGARVLLAVTIDLVCCGNWDLAPEDRVRRIEAEAVREAVLRSLGAHPDPDLRIVAGDFNLVGSPAPLALAGRGLARGGANLVPVHAPQLDLASNATWDGRGGPFPPGQLDYVLYDPGAVTVERAFTFETDDLAPEVLDRLGLRAEDSATASDHLPIVVDFAWR